jgi:putative tricarboxylic transport membrane protein
VKRWDQVASLIGIGLGLLVAIFSLRLEIGKWNNPGPGFLPFASGILLILICAIYGVGVTWKKNDIHNEIQSPWPRQNRKHLIGVLAALLLYVILLPIIGYFTITFFLLIYLLRVITPDKWLFTIIEAVIIVIASYLIFDKWLLIQFPKGFLGF